jgi:2-hydroxy-6-oxonona-2,4-dienedioate hydrolase/4,5:9,10-diseco-3-hydroxy-5,9,17-trioxoandrosta-1(10),2-diene-4-oate hydrolase
MAVLTPEQIELRDAAIFDVPGYGGKRPAPWLTVDWSEHRKTAMVSGRDVNYIDYGDPKAPPVVLIHGLVGCWQNWLSNIVGLGEKFRVIALDLPGFGASASPADPISLSLYANTVAGLLDHLKIKKAHVIGNSMGGMTSLQLAIDHPKRVDKVVLVSPAGWSTTHSRHSAAQFAPRPLVRQRMLRGIAAHPRRLAPETVLELIGTGRNDGFAAALRAILGTDFRDQLPGVKHEVLLIWGRRDGVITYRDIFGFADALPNLEWKLIGNAAHVAMVEHPEWFDETTIEFLT